MRVLKLTPRLLTWRRELPVRGPRKGSRSVGGKYEEGSLGRVELEKPIGGPDGDIQGRVDCKSGAPERSLP